MKIKNKAIAAIVVTFNRKECLSKCLNALIHQSYLPTTIFIIDNASTDGTKEAIENKGYKLVNSKSIKQFETEIYYLRLNENLGGAGGFYYGLKTAFDLNRYDAFWIMDDDGVPETNCLEEMIPYLNDYDYISPICLSNENPEYLAFDHKNCPNTQEYINSFSQNGIIKDDAFPFNGVMYSVKFIKIVGFPKKELFIWGDEANFSKRAKKAGFIPVTIISAIHYHPYNRASYTKVSLFGKEKRIIITDSKLRFYCMHRNAAYNAKIDSFTIATKNLILRYLIFSKYYIFIEKSLKKWLLFNSAFFSGLFNNFNGHKKLIKN